MGDKDKESLIKVIDYSKKCDTCGRKMNIIDYMISSTCLDCCKKQHDKVAGK